MKTELDRIWFKHSTFAYENKCYMSYQEFLKAIEEAKIFLQPDVSGNKANQSANKKDGEVAVLPIEIIRFIDKEIKSWKGMYEEGGKNQASSGAIIALKDVRKKIFEINKGNDR